MDNNELYSCSGPDNDPENSNQGLDLNSFSSHNENVKKEKS